MLDGSNSRNPLSDAIRGNLQICYAASASATTKQPIISNLMLFVSETIEAAKLVGTCKLVCGTNIMHSYRLWLESLETRLIETVQIFACQCKRRDACNQTRAHTKHVDLGTTCSKATSQPCTNHHKSWVGRGWKPLQMMFNSGHGTSTDHQASTRITLWCHQTWPGKSSNWVGWFSSHIRLSRRIPKDSEGTYQSQAKSRDCFCFNSHWGCGLVRQVLEHTWSETLR